MGFLLKINSNIKVLYMAFESINAIEQMILNFSWCMNVYIYLSIDLNCLCNLLRQASS